MAAFAYVLLPVSGLFAYLGGRDARTRFHGLQAIALGLLWPVALYLGAAVSRSVTAAVAALGALVWLVLFLGAAIGRDPRIPLLGRFLKRAAATAPGSI